MGYRYDMRWLGGLLVVLALLPPLLDNNYYLTVLTMCCLNAMIAVGLSLLVGHAGQISLGHAGFYGLAAYTTAALSTTLGVPVGRSLGGTSGHRQDRPLDRTDHRAASEDVSAGQRLDKAGRADRVLRFEAVGHPPQQLRENHA